MHDDVLWRSKTNFSDGVGDSYISLLRNQISRLVTDEEMQQAQLISPHSPTSKEAFYYRKVFSELFPGSGAVNTVC